MPAHSVLLRNFINSHYVEAHGRNTFECINPVNEQTVAISPISNQADVEAAYGAARQDSVSGVKARPHSANAHYWPSLMHLKHRVTAL